MHAHPPRRITSYNVCYTKLLRRLMVLSGDKKANLYQWNEEDNSLVDLPMDEEFLMEATSYYQVADYLYRNNGLQLNE